jgi:hypothetical protein
MRKQEGILSNHQHRNHREIAWGKRLVISALMLHSGSKANLNMKSAFLHILSDEATSLIVAALGVLWLFKPWFWLDPVFCSSSPIPAMKRSYCAVL